MYFLHLNPTTENSDPKTYGTPLGLFQRGMSLGNAEKKNSDHRGLPLSIVKSYTRIQF